MGTKTTRQLTTPPVYPPDRLVDLLHHQFPADLDLDQPIKLPPIYSSGFLAQASFALDSLIASLESRGHGLDSLIASLIEAQHAVDSLLAARSTIGHDIDSLLSVLVSSGHDLDSLLCPTPGVAIFGPGSGLWTAPPGIANVHAFLWGMGGKGNAYFPPSGGSGGGGGGYSEQINAPVTPGAAYSYVVEPDPGPAVHSLFAFDTGTITASRGQPGTTAGGGAGGFGGGGDLNFTGGNGGDGGLMIASTFGAGGGSSAGPQGNGVDGDDADPAFAGMGGIAPAGFGDGGQGGIPTGTTHGLNGQYPGGGGGGQAYEGSAGTHLTDGAGGLLILVWNAGVFFIDSVISGLVTSAFSLESVIAALSVTQHDVDSYLLDELLADDGISPLWADDGATWLTPG